MRKLIAIGLLTVCLAGCAAIQNLSGIYTLATTSTVPPDQVAIVANAFDGLKVTASNYGAYCVQNKFAGAACTPSIRRKVVAAIRSGTAARNALEASINTGQPALSTVYNTLVAAVNNLQSYKLTATKGQ